MHDYQDREVENINTLSPEAFLELHSQTFAHLHDGVDATKLAKERLALEEARRIGRVKRASMQILADDIHGLDRRSIYDQMPNGRRPLSLVAKIHNRQSNSMTNPDFSRSSLGLYYSSPPNIHYRRASTDSHSTSSPLPTTPHFDYPTVLETVPEPPSKLSPSLYDPPSCVGTSSHSVRESVARSDLTWDEGFSGDGDDLGLAARYVVSAEAAPGDQEILNELEAEQDDQEREKQVLEQRRRRILAIAQSTRLLEGKATRIPDDPSNWGSSDPGQVYLRTLQFQDLAPDPDSLTPTASVEQDPERESNSSTPSGWGLGFMRKWWTAEQAKRLSNLDNRPDFHRGETGIEDGSKTTDWVSKDYVDILDQDKEPRNQNPVPASAMSELPRVMTVKPETTWKSRRLSGFFSPFQQTPLSTHFVSAPLERNPTQPLIVDLSERHSSLSSVISSSPSMMGVQMTVGPSVGDHSKQKKQLPKSTSFPALPEQLPVQLPFPKPLTFDHCSYRYSFPQNTILGSNHSAHARLSDPTYNRLAMKPLASNSIISIIKTPITAPAPVFQAALIASHDTIPSSSPKILHNPPTSPLAHIFTSDKYIPHHAKPHKARLPLTAWCFFLGFILGPWLWFVGGWAVSSNEKSNPLTRDVEGCTSLKANRSIWVAWIQDDDPWIRKCRWASLVSGILLVPVVTLAIALPVVLVR